MYRNIGTMYFSLEGGGVHILIIRQVPFHNLFGISQGSV